MSKTEVNATRDEDIREFMETLNEWFAARATGETDIMSEAVMFRELNMRLDLWFPPVRQDG